MGRRQQDSHEALRHLMEGVREEHKEVKKHWVPRWDVPGNIREKKTYLTVINNVGKLFSCQFRSYCILFIGTLF